MAALNRRSVLYHGNDFISVPLRLIIMFQFNIY